MYSIVCFHWNTGFREYTAGHVNALARQAKKHCSLPHRFICVTDHPEDDFSDDVEVIETPPKARAIGAIPSPEGARFPSSYRRLWAFSEEATILGEVILQLDIDCLITDDLLPLLVHEPDEPFVGWQPSSAWGPIRRVRSYTHGIWRIGGGTWRLNTGEMTHLWEDFVDDPINCIRRARKADHRGSDQAYLTHRLQGCAVWPQDAGIFQAQQMKEKRFAHCPKGARIVHFNGKVKPWQALQIPWIKDAYRVE